jgi:hypothetical protein
MIFTKNSRIPETIKANRIIKILEEIDYSDKSIIEIAQQCNNMYLLILRTPKELQISKPH